MVRQVVNIEQYWKVVVYYFVDYDLFSIVTKDLKSIGVTDREIKLLYGEMMKKKIKAVTYSSLYYHTSIILILPHLSIGDFLNSIVHEAEHVKQVMLKAYYVEDAGEPPAYTIGYLVMKMYGTFKHFL